jgi:hypothetical protein
MPAEAQRLPGRVLAEAGLQHVAHQHLLDLVAGTFARRSASATARPPSCGAVNEAKAPWNLPIAVRQAETITGRPILDARGSEG